jgi:hypothetical protein
MKRIVLLAALALAACDPVVSSDEPLFPPEAARARPGLWALLETDGCPAPTTDRVQDWPNCSTPLWLSPDTVTYMLSGPVKQRLIVSPGQPWIAQIVPVQGGVPPFASRSLRQREAANRPTPGPDTITADTAPSTLRDTGTNADRYTYLAVRPVGAAPVREAWIWQLPCPTLDEPLPEGMTRTEDGVCLAQDGKTVREAAAAAMRAGPGQRVVWVAEAR